MAPKCTPDEGALHTEHGKPLNNSATVGLFGFSSKTIETDPVSDELESVVHAL